MTIKRVSIANKCTELVQELTVSYSKAQMAENVSRVSLEAERSRSLDRSVRPRDQSLREEQS